jgi:hypothetical protein
MASNILRPEIQHVKRYGRYVDLTVRPLTLH